MAEPRRSRTGCLTCRQRKLKCDEVKPECNRCRRTSRRCQPGDGTVFRHQQNASMNSNATLGGCTLGSKKFYNYRDTFAEGQTWVDVPRNITFSHVSNPYAVQETQEEALTELPIRHHDEINRSGRINGGFEASNDNTLIIGLEALSAVAEADQPLLHIRHRGTSTCDKSQDEEMIRSPAVANHYPEGSTIVMLGNFGVPFSTQSNPRLWIAYNEAFNSSIPKYDHNLLENLDKESENETDVVYLMRTFSETTGSWMDAFDSNRYFSHYVPVKANYNSLLQHAACACAAKQLSRVKNPKEPHKQPNNHVYQDTVESHWAWQGTIHYEKAVKLLADEIMALRDYWDAEHGRVQTSTDLPTGESPVPLTTAPPVINYKVNLSDNITEILVAVAVLGTCAFLDNHTAALTEHLRLANQLFDLLYQIEVAHKDELNPPRFSRAGRATFWNLVRQDFLVSFIIESHTQMEGKDLSSWLAAGLLLDEDGHTLVGKDNNDDDYRRDDMASNALIWIVAKIVNFLAAGDSIDNVFPQDPSSPTSLIGINQLTLLEYWLLLEKELDKWSQDIPETFTPYARINASVSTSSLFTEVWFSNPMCASTMQLYHMARILLLVNKPQESTAKRTTLGSRLHSYRFVDAETRYHSREICGIAVGISNASARIHMVQPLFIAGQCLTDASERESILNTLKEIESELGWATECYVKQLLSQWTSISEGTLQEL